MSGARVLGIGARPGVRAADVLTLARSLPLEGCDRMALPFFRAEEPGLREAARVLALEVVVVDAASLRAVQPYCATRSVAAERATGFASVAEGCALAAAGIEAWLVMPRRDGRGVTGALACGRGRET
ncbi:cobalamin biosynthesis protein CbiG [Ameyamaea chiangmaiensis NBRC 103196]|uniref:Cobalamin biosynthesis protein n=1 Tax=Ameyamaea chiangmaiensis TaxID=442969 RepID=A0A850PHM5_9PROT|nr:cobalamin biosynthesis protein [Ameyamaea chiangmaiensis]MBS4076258.1 cobalamin biosynthesis protein [Ameyamaea chiangmaiensis]NVN42139.1 cobalamin biosynthesis protein [Ameyamaea chiangmaiensis]GBQ64733.1 cobalamin biosynthesis protein CbiG [Ameyamaea chiangmaiensis NBRC 103196]